MHFQALLYCEELSQMHLRLRKKEQIICCNYELDVDMNGIYKSETGNYGNSNMT